MQIRRLVPADAAAFQSLRLGGLRECPSAFASSYEEEYELALDVVAERLQAGADRVVLGALSGPVLAGIVGVEREALLKLSHKAHIWGFYVAPAFRRQGIGRRLVDAALQHAYAMPGVRQVNLSVDAANTPAIALYEAAGFTTFGVERAFMHVDGIAQDERHMVHCATGAHR
jgi:ribosomal protein S18 acetylase RimI-like enzyme